MRSPAWFWPFALVTGFAHVALAIVLWDPSEFLPALLLVWIALLGIDVNAMRHELRKQGRRPW